MSHVRCYVKSWKFAPWTVCEWLIIRSFCSLCAQFGLNVSEICVIGQLDVWASGNWVISHSWHFSSMIDIQLYRIRIGYYNKFKICKLVSTSNGKSSDDPYTYLLYTILLYLLYAIYSISITLAIICKFPDLFCYSPSAQFDNRIIESHCQITLQ